MYVREKNFVRKFQSFGIYWRRYSFKAYEKIIKTFLNEPLIEAYGRP